MVLEPWRDQHPLEGSIWKLNRAEKHLKTIDQYLIDFDALNPHRLVSQLNRDKTLWEVRLQAIFPPFVDFGSEIGEFCYQVRSALDHVIFALSEFPDDLTGKDLDRALRRPAYPILLEENNGVLANNTSHIKRRIADKVRGIVDGKQPYKRGDRDAASLDPLALLDELGNTDKHRMFKLLPVTITVNLEGLAPGIKTTQRGSANHGNIIAWLPADLDPEVDFYPRVSAKVVLPVTRQGGYVFMENLWLIYNYVRQTVLPEFEQFFPPLPASLIGYNT